MLDAWFSEKLAPDGDLEDGVHPEEVQALKDYVLQLKNAKEAAHAITRPIEGASNPGKDLARLWGFLTDALVELPPENLEALVALLQAIENLPEPDFSRVEQQDLPAHGILWRGLPGFGHHYADACYLDPEDWRRANAKDESDSTSERERLLALRTRQANVEARLAVAGLGGVPIDWGYERVANALERTIEDDGLLQLQVAGAAEWLTIAGDRFKQGAAREEESWALEMKKNDLWQGGKVMTPERWSFWRSRLGSLMGRIGPVHNKADLALGSM